MLNAKLICVGKLKERFFSQACDEYIKRLGSYCRLEISELSEYLLSDSPSDKEIAAALDREAKLIRKAILKEAYIISLCVEGQEIDSPGFAELIRNCENSGNSKLCFIIGGSFGLAQSIKDESSFCLSMSKMTLPHHLARVFLLEQRYRCFKINEGSRYHK